MTFVLKNYQATEKIERKRTTEKDVLKKTKNRKYPEHLHSREIFYLCSAPENL